MRDSTRAINLDPAGSEAFVDIVKHLAYLGAVARCPEVRALKPVEENLVFLDKLVTADDLVTDYGRALLHHVFHDGTPNELKSSGAAVGSTIASIEIEVTDRLRAAPNLDDEGNADEVIRHAIAILRAIGLEDFDESLVPILEPGGSLAILTEPVTPLSAAALLHDRVLADVDSMAHANPYLRVEWMASVWWFRKHSRDWNVEADLRDAYTRAREWGLIDRRLPAADGLSTLALFNTGEHVERYGPRSRKLAKALEDSFAGIFVVAGHEESITVLEDPMTGNRYRVHEPDFRDEQNGVGNLALGRLTPHEAEIWFPSSAMRFTPVPRATDAAAFARSAFVDGAVDPALAVERAISSLFRNGRVRSDATPAASPADARKLIEEVGRALGFLELEKLDDWVLETGDRLQLETEAVERGLAGMGHILTSWTRALAAMDQAVN